MQALTACCAAALLFGGILSTARSAQEPELKTGDVVFQTSRSAQSTAIQHATGSPYSHVGLVEVTSEGVFVIEAVQPVSRTPWRVWRERGEGGKVLAKRVAGLSEEQAAHVVKAAHVFLGRPYDSAFAWDDARLYCSELVRKAFERGASISLGKQQRLDTLDLDGLEGALQTRFGKRVPKERMLVTPVSIAEDSQLEQIWTNY